MTVLPRRALSQPLPHLVPAGDCGGCCLAGLLGLPLEIAYVLAGEPPRALSWESMRSALYSAKAQGLLEQVVDDVPVFPTWEGKMTFGLPGWAMESGWFAWLRMAIESGHYAVATVDHGQRGPVGDGDHFVLLVGVRETWKETRPGVSILVREVLVSCSSRATPDEEWVEAGAFLRQRGGYNVLLARPAP